MAKTGIGTDSVKGDVDDGRSYAPQGKGKIKTGPRSLNNSMKVRQPKTKTCGCGVKYTEGGECPMC